MPNRTLKEGTKVKDIISGKVGRVRYTLWCGDVVIDINGMVIRRKRKKVKEVM